MHEKKGFTVIEIMVAMSIISIISIGILSLTIAFLNSYYTLSGVNELNNNASFALDEILTDLQHTSFSKTRHKIINADYDIIIFPELHILTKLDFADISGNINEINDLVDELVENEYIVPMFIPEEEPEEYRIHPKFTELNTYTDLNLDAKWNDDKEAIYNILQKCHVIVYCFFESESGIKQLRRYSDASSIIKDFPFTENRIVVTSNEIELIKNNGQYITFDRSSSHDRALANFISKIKYKESGKSIVIKVLELEKDIKMIGGLSYRKARVEFGDATEDYENHITITPRNRY